MRFAKNSQDSFDKFSRSTTTAFANVAKSAGAAVVAFASVSTVINKLTESFQFADQINDIAKANEVAVGTILKLSQALSLNGGNAADASKIFAGLTQSIDQAAQGSEETQKRFASLGVTLEDLRTLDGQQIFDKTLAGLQNIEDPIKRNAAAVDLLSKAVKGVDIAGLAGDYSSNQGNFDDAEESFKAIGEAMDRLDSFTFKTSQTLAETFGPALLSIINVVDDLVFGFDKLERNISKTANANAKFKSAPRIGDAPVAGAFNLPPEFQAQSPEVRQVIDKAAQKAQQDAQRAADKARDAAIEAKRKATEEAKNLDLQESVYRANLEKDYQKQLRDNFEKRKKDEADAEKEAYEQKLKNLNLLQEAANRNFEEAQRQAQEVAEEAKRSAQEINRSLTDALLRGFESGKSFAQNFRDTLVNMFQTLVLRPIINFVLNQSGITSLLGGIGTLFSGSAVAGGGGSSGGFGDLGSIFSSVKNIFTNGLESANIGFEQSIQEFGTFITKFGSFGESIGGAISQYSGAISNVLPYAGAFMKLLQGDVKGAAITATTTAIGSIFGPIGAGIGAVVGSLLGGVMGGGLPPRVTENRTGSFVNGVFTAGDGSAPGKRGKIGGGSQLDALNEAFATNLNTLFSAFGVNSNIYLSSALTKKKNTRALSDVFMDGQYLGRSENSVGKKGSFQDAFNMLMEDLLGNFTVKAIQASSLPDGIKKFFDNLTNKEDVTNTINTLIAMKNALVDLPPIFNAVRNAIDTTAYTTTLEQLQAQFQATQTFVDLFYSGTEKFDIFTNQLLTQFDALNQTIPTSRDQYRALVESINVVDEATRDQFNGLIALAPAMNEYFGYLEKQREEIEALNGALRGSDYFSTLTDFQRYQGVARNFGGVAANDTLIRDNSLMIGELKALRSEIIALRQANESTATSSKKTADLLTQVTEDGNALLTVAA